MKNMFNAMFALGSFAGMFVVPMVMSYMGMTMTLPMAVLAWLAVLVAFAVAMFVRDTFFKQS